jgi:hypothetical protein
MEAAAERDAAREVTPEEEPQTDVAGAHGCASAWHTAAGSVATRRCVRVRVRRAPSRNGPLC